MPTPQPEPKRLIPRRPPGRSDRKALHYADDVRRLRAEGYSLEAIRLALREVGVSVSLSTVRREVARSPIPRELELKQDADFWLDQFQLNGAAQATLPSARLIDEATCQATDPTSEKPGPTPIRAARCRRALGVLSKPLELLRNLWRARQPP